MDDPKELFYPQYSIAEDFNDWTVQNDQLGKETSFARIKEYLEDDTLKIEDQPNHYSIYCGGWFVAYCGYYEKSEEIAQTIVKSVKCHNALVEACGYGNGKSKLSTKIISFLRKSGKSFLAEELETKQQLEEIALNKVEEKIETRKDF